MLRSRLNAARRAGRDRAPLRVLRSVLAGIVLAAASGVGLGADDVATRVQSVIDAIKAGDVAAAVAKLGPETSDVAARIDLVHVLCDRAYRYPAANRDREAQRVFAQRIVDLANAVRTAAPDDDRTRWALAQALVVRERSGPRTGPAAWTQSADLLQQVHAKRPDDVLPLVHAASILLEGACSDPEASVALADRADAVARTALERQKDSPTVAVSVASAQFWAARTLLAGNKKLAREQVKAVFETLRRTAKREPPVLEVATLWNEALSYSVRSGFVFPERFVVAQHTTFDGALAFDVPVSSRWHVQNVPPAGDQVGYDYVSQTTEDGKRLRQVLFRRYSFSQKYTFEGPNPVGGDNVRSLAQGLQAMVAARVLAPGATLAAPARKPFHKEMDGYVFEARGRTATDAGTPGDPLRVTCYVMRGGRQSCLAVLVYDYGTSSDPSPEIENLVASLREPGK